MSENKIVSINKVRITELKTEIFDLLEQQQVHQYAINELEKTKAEKYKELNNIRKSDG